MFEKNIQREIIKFLESEGWYVVKVIRSNKNGVPDLICCGPDGQFVGIEVKNEIGKVSELQKHNGEKIKKAGGRFIVARSLLDVINS